jgi:predicted Zn-dependent protease
MPSTSISYYNGAVLTKYISATQTAVSRWNGETAPISFVQSTNSTTSKIFVTAINAVDTYYAVTSGNCSAGLWSGRVTITWNDTGSYNLTTAQLRMVGVHEFGHALGLGHRSASCSSTKTVMVQGTTKWSCGWGSDDPWADDVAGVNAIY